MTLIAAIDPGVMTGVAWFQDNTFGADQFDETHFYKWVDEHAEQFDHLQIEQFTITDATIRKGRVYDSLYLIGYLRYKAWQCDFPTGFTKPSDVMAPFNDAALKRAKMHTPGKGHANDAARHLAYHLVRTKKMSGSVFLPK